MRPDNAYTVEVMGLPKLITVDPAREPKSHDGQPFSLLSILLAAGVELDHACGGVLACSTCHVYIESGSAGEASDEEEDQLDYAPDIRDESRLACAVFPDGSTDIQISIPARSRNEVRE